MDFILAGSPVLENLGIVGSRKKATTRLLLVGQHLRCVQICLSAVDSVAVVDTPSLERLLLLGSMTRHDGSCIRLKIGKAPKLRVLGYLDPGIHMLEIRNTVINVHTILTFGKTDGVDGKVNLKFWQEAGPIECIQSCIKMMTFREFRMKRSEVAFLKFFFQSAQVLKNAVIVGSNGSFTSIPENRPSKSCHVLVYESSDPDGGAVWSLQKGFDFSVSDPLYYR
ncbi:hypothetical protein BAE44_0025514 [Dichanthelium oligosanthes]|uniref:Uncharacterized protein n=1 Tax=Dichanthelium oligosanthes TaxID=888268 RepID=A0A1E5UKS2_9POAL|nr:hypothetical protein BAE44_0025514 [Dichanthelium oligosanthes]